MKNYKPVLALLLAISLIVPFTACAKTEAEANTPAQRLYRAFQEEAKTETSPERIAEVLLLEDWLPFAGVSMAVEPGNLMGFTEPITGFSEGAVFAPMIGAIPFIGYIFQLREGQDVEAFIDALQNAADLRWNVCTQAEELVTGSVGRTVFFAMSPLEFEP